MANISKPYRTVNFMLINGNAYSADDNYKYGVGTGAWEALKARRDVCFPVNDNGDVFEVFIPFHAVGAAALVRTSSSVAAPVDAVCVAE